MKVKLFINQRTGATAKHTGLSEHVLDAPEGAKTTFELCQLLSTNRAIGSMVTITVGEKQVSFWPEDVVRIETAE